MELPQELEFILKADSLNEIHIGKSRSRVFHAAGKSGQKYFLKVTEEASLKQVIENEVRILSWLSERKIPVPIKVSLLQREQRQFFLLTEVPGRSMADLASVLGPKECMRIGAEFLRRLHGLDIRDCPFRQDLTITKRLAIANLQNGLVDENDFDEENKGKSAEQIYLELDMSFDEDLVFTHGNFCFPNIICMNNSISGVIDLGRAGVADRYQDIGLFLRSFKKNLVEPDLQLFLEHYRLVGRFDTQKSTFYKKLDEFF